jgi:hypothetical protein
MKHRIRVQCTECGKVTFGRLPKGGDGSFLFPRMHYVSHTRPTVNAKICPGVTSEGKWVSELSGNSGEGKS